MGDAKIRTGRTDAVTEAICNRTSPYIELCIEPYIELYIGPYIELYIELYINI